MYNFNSNNSMQAAVPEQEQAQLFAFVVSEILAALPQALEAQANYDARCMAVAFAAEIVASSAKDPSFNVTSAIASAVAEVAAKVNTAVETKHAKKSSACTDSKTTAAVATVGIRTADGRYAANLSDEDVRRLQEQANAMFAQQAMPNGMQLVQMDGIVYVQMPVLGDDGAPSILLVPLENIHSAALQQRAEGGDYQLTIQTLSVRASAQGAGLMPQFQQRQLVLSSALIEGIFGANPAAEEIERRLNAERALLERLIAAYEHERQMCSPLWPKPMAVMDIPVMPVNGFVPSDEDLPATSLQFSRAI